MISKTAFAFRRTLVATVLCIALFAAIAPGFAAAAGSSPTADQQTPTNVQHFTGSGSGGSGSGLNGRVGPLPFTGFDVLSMAAVALAVTGLGLALQRAVSRRPHEDVGDSARL